MIRLCIFDLDGTLIDSLGDLADCCNEVLRGKGYPTHPTDAYRQFVGNGIPMLIQRILPESARTEAEMCAVREQFDARYRAHCLDQTKPYAGVTELLCRCREQGLILTVLSNKAEPFAQFICREIFGDEAFRAVCGQRADLPKKPAPDGVLALLRQFDVAPDEAVLIGDSNVDIQTAIRAGIHSIGACWGFRGQTELEQAGADRLAQKPLDCYPLLQESFCS